MRKFVLLPLLLTAACAQSVQVAAPEVAAIDPGRSCATVASAQAGSEQLWAQHPLLRRASAAWTPPVPMPPGPPNAPAYLINSEPVLGSTGDPKVDAWRARVFQQGGSEWRPYLLRAFAGVCANPAILAANEALNPPPSPAEFVNRYVTPETIAAGKRLYAKMKGSDIVEAKGHAPLEVRLALWGIVADYGTNPPRFDMIETLANLGAYGKGPGWGEFNIYHAVRILAEGRIERAGAKAYPEGRIGQVRWLADQYLGWGTDGDGDGKVDIWANRADIMANLRIPAWEPDSPLVIEVERPRFDMSEPRQARLAQAMLGTQSVGVNYFGRPGGQPWPADAARWSGRYVEPFGDAGPFYLLSRNFTPVNYLNPFRPRYWNDDGDWGFGLAVALLADAIAGRPGPTRPIR